jgi:hypothetical protein
VSQSAVREYEDLGRSPTRLEKWLYAPAIPDWFAAGYFFTVVVGLTRSPDSAARNFYLLLVMGVLATYLAGVYFFRLRYELRVSRRAYAPSLAYHLLPLAAILTVFFNLRAILPMLNGALYDETLHHLTVRMLGFEPTLALEPYSSPIVVEWFAFFYYAYFFLIASFIFVMIFTSRSEKRLAYFATGFLMIVTVGHFIYAQVPGLGPYAYLAHEYQAPLHGGVFYWMVLDTVSAAGAMRDIFPSLHTALPMFLTFFAWKHYPKVAPITTLFAVNIMGATLVLRWHYAIDVVAGLILALVVHWGAPRLVELYQSRRESVGLGHLRRW